MSNARKMIEQILQGKSPAQVVEAEQRVPGARPWRGPEEAAEVLDQLADILNQTYFKLHEAEHEILNVGDVLRNNQQWWEGSVWDRHIRDFVANYKHDVDAHIKPITDRLYQTYMHGLPPLAKKMKG